MSLGPLDHWVSMSFLAAAAWALSCVIDVCFVDNGIYRRASDGAAIAGLFCLVPAVFTAGSVDWTGISWAVTGVGVASGIVFLLHIYFYFKALFALNDAVNSEIFNTLGVLIVPLLAFVLLGERLAWFNYAAIAGAVFGISVLIGSQFSRLSWRGIAYLVASVVSVSLLMVMQAWVLQTASYATTVWLFSTTAFIAVLLIFGVPTVRRRRIRKMCRQFGSLFVFVQLLELGAVLASQRATDLSPSVSLVALLECSLPIFVMAFSWLIAVCARQWRPARWQSLLAVLSEQTISAPSKVASMLLIVGAISLATAWPNFSSP